MMTLINNVFFIFHNSHYPKKRVHNNENTILFEDDIIGITSFIILA